MNKPKALSTWQLIHESLGRNVPVMLLYVLESHGSSPGRQGFLMAVNVLGEMAGSIGGGIMEHKFIELAKETLRNNAATLSIRTQYHDKKATHNQSGMICSGDQTILQYYVQSSDAQSVQAIVNCLIDCRNGLLTLSPSGIQFSPDLFPETDYEFTIRSERDWWYQERIGFTNHLFIIGGGHCALALSQLMSMMDFCIHVYDNRPDLHTMQQNDVAHEKIVVDDYSQLTNLIPSGNHHYIVIMTFGYRTDDTVIRALIGKRVHYFGVLGSQTKIDRLFSEYRQEGFNNEALRRIHAPIGIPIHSQTPEEIAVSIAAQIIQVKNKR